MSCPSDQRSPLIDRRFFPLGCAGMAGMDQTVREACVEYLGEETGSRIRIVDGVISGFIHLDGTLRAIS